MFLRQQHILILPALADLLDHVLQSGPMALLGQTHQGTPLLVQDVIPPPGLQLAYQRHTAEFVVAYDYHSRVFGNPLPTRASRARCLTLLLWPFPWGIHVQAKGKARRRKAKLTITTCAR